MYWWKAQRVWQRVWQRVNRQNSHTFWDAKHTIQGSELGYHLGTIHPGKLTWSLEDDFPFQWGKFVRFHFINSHGCRFCPHIWCFQPFILINWRGLIAAKIQFGLSDQSLKYAHSNLQLVKWVDCSKRWSWDIWPRWWFQSFCIFTLTWRDDPIWL